MDKATATEKLCIEDARKRMLDGLQEAWDAAGNISHHDYAAVALSAGVNVLADIIASVTANDPAGLESVLDATYKRLPIAIAERHSAWSGAKPS